MLIPRMSASTVEIPGYEASAVPRGSGFDERIERRQIDRWDGWCRSGKLERCQPAAPLAVRALEQSNRTDPTARALQEGAGPRPVHTGGMTLRAKLLDDGHGLPRLDRLLHGTRVGGGARAWIRRRPELRNQALDPVEKRLGVTANGVVFDTCNTVEHFRGYFRAARDAQHVVDHRRPDRFVASDQVLVQFFTGTQPDELDGDVLVGNETR